MAKSRSKTMNIKEKMAQIIWYSDKNISADQALKLTDVIIAVLKAEKKAKKKEAKEALESMIWQFAYRGIRNKKPVLYTGGLSALEEAFEALGWTNPYFLTKTEIEDTCCEVIDCYESSSAGTCWGELYLRLCHTHYIDSYSGKPLPPVKTHALEREKKRNKITRILEAK
jgi:hypothetical protein